MSGRQKGATVKTPKVYTSDVLNSMTMLKFTAYVHPEDVPNSPLVCEPRRLDLEAGDDSREHKLSFKNITMDTVQMKLVWVDRSYLDVKVPETKIGPGERANVTVRIDPDRYRQRFETSFTIETNDKDLTRITVPVTFGRSSAPTSKVSRN